MSAANYGPVLAAVTATAEAYARAIRELESLAAADGIESGAGFTKEGDALAARAGEIVLAVERTVGEARRPKGPKVRIVVSARYAQSYEVVGEVIRTTPAQAMVRDQNGRETAYKIEDGRAVKRAQSGESWRRVHADDLAMVQAMKPGANSVSKALDEIKKASKS